MGPEIWIALSAVMLILEAITVGLTCIWLAVGAFAAFIISFATGNIYIQLVVFIVVSAASFVFMRPFLKRYMPVKDKTNNTSRLIGEKAIVAEKITAVGGRVKVGDILWLAESTDGKDIEENAVVKIIKAKSNKLIVEKM